MNLHLDFYNKDCKGGFKNENMFSAIAIFILSILFLVFIVSFTIPSIAQIIEVSIIEIIKGKMKISYDQNMENILKINVEFFNSGSVGYQGRARMDVYDQSELVFTGWSNEAPLLPGIMKNFYLHWYPLVGGNYSAKIKFYFANEIEEANLLNFSIQKNIEPEDAFEILDFRTYDNYVKFRVKVNQSLDDKTLNDIIIIPSGYPMGWIFEQTKRDLNKGKRVVLNYQPSLWKEANVTINVVTEDGRYFTTKTFNLKKETGLRMYIHHIVDALTDFFNL